MSNPTLLIDSGHGERRVSLFDYLDAEAVETAEREANRWIKSLRHARVDGLALRDRLTYRGDSLWWFVELYLHKNRTVVAIHRALLAFERLIARERPTRMVVSAADPVIQVLAPQVAKRSGIAYQGPAVSPWRTWRARVAIEAKSAFHTVTALGARVRAGKVQAVAPRGEGVSAFVHTAFWRPSDDEEGYIGPVLGELTKRLPPGGVGLVGVGPRTTFRTRSWRTRWAAFRDPQSRATPVIPVEAFTTWHTIRPSLALWRQRKPIARALIGSEDLRHASVIRGCDVWPLVQLELYGVAALQLPWSARAMDEAGAVMERQGPRAIVTYAEAGGWGRAIMLEARRRGIPTIGLQHGFIYRHWLNYLHEPDEMRPSAANPTDAGFPAPTVTLVYDEFTEAHLVDAGNFRRDAIAVTGSARLDALVEQARALTPDALERVRRETGANPGQGIVTVAAKFTQIESVFGALVNTVSGMPDVHLVVKCHPADTPDPYERLARGVPNVVVAPASRDLASLIAASRLVVTVNSTAAIEAMVLGVPALVLSLPNNLSPFVDAGAIEGVGDPAEIEPTLRRVLYDEDYRARLARNRQVFLTQYGIRSDGCAASRAADRIMGFVTASRESGHRDAGRQEEDKPQRH